MPDDTYTILIEGFRGERSALRFDVRLTVEHPGPGFSDHLSSVTSYEAIIDILRRLAGETDDGVPMPDVASTGAERLLALPKVHQVRIRLTRYLSNGEALGCEVISPST